MSTTSVILSTTEMFTQLWICENKMMANNTAIYPAAGEKAEYVLFDFFEKSEVKK
jgi:hypothetical protein